MRTRVSTERALNIRASFSDSLMRNYFSKYLYANLYCKSFYLSITEFVTHHPIPKLTIAGRNKPYFPLTPFFRTLPWESSRKSLRSYHNACP